MTRPRRLTLSALRLLYALAVAAGPCAASAEIIYLPSPGLDVALQKGLPINCLNNLKQIYFAARLWSNANGGQFPSAFQVFTNQIGSPAMLFCPASSGNPSGTNWENLDWSKINYQWIPQANWDQPSAIVCKCLLHEHELHADGSVLRINDYPNGWPAIVAGPLYQLVTPGSDVRFEVRIAPNVQAPLSYQWRREQLYYVTNATFISDPYDPNGGYWVTNRQAKFNVTLLGSETNSSYLLPNAQSNHSDYYSVTISNAIGTNASHKVRLSVDPAVQEMSTNEHWSATVCLNNLKQIALLGRTWAFDHNDHMPQNLSEMTNVFGSPLFGWPIVLFCRSDHARTAPSDWSSVNFADTSYEIVPGDEQDLNAPFCRCKVHGFYAQMDGDIVSGPRFLGIRSLPDRTRELEIKIFAGRTNILEASTNLLNWETLTSYSATNGPILFQDTNNLPTRFYRVRLP